VFPNPTPTRPENSTTGRKPPTFRTPASFRILRAALGALAVVSPTTAGGVAERLFLTPRRSARRTDARAVLATGRRIALPTAYGDLAAWRWGASGGPATLLVHGWEGHGAQLGAFVEPLVAEGLSVVTFDAPAHGDSPGRFSSIVHFAEGVTAAARTLGLLRGIVTHSMGGAGALWASRDGLLAERLVLIAPPIDVADFTGLFARTMGLSEQIREDVHRRLHRRLGVPVEALRAERVVGRLRGPLLVVHDEDDREVPIRCGETIARAWPGAELVRTRGLGHRRILRDVETVRRIVRFVAHGPAAVSGGEV